MILRQVRLSNVGLYGGDQSLEFSREKSRPVTLVGGKNGAGKTTLLNAIPLALYGNRAKAIIGAPAYPEYLDKLIHTGSATASIALEFDRREGGKTIRYVVEREWSRSPNGKSADLLHVHVNERPRSDLEASWPEFVEGIMPLSVSGLAMFDGEKIEALADVSNSADVLRTSLFGLLGLDLVERLQRDLADYRRRTAHAVLPDKSSLSFGLGEAEDRLGVAIDELDVLKSELRSAERSLETAERDLTAANDELESAGGNDASAREHLHAELAAAESNIDIAMRRLEGIVAGELPLLLVRSLLTNVIAMGEMSQKANEAQLLFVRMKERDERLIAELSKRNAVFPEEVAAAFVRLLDADRKIYEVHQAGGFEIDPSAKSAASQLVGENGDDLRREVDGLVASINEFSVVAELARKSLGSVPTGDAFEVLVRAVAEAEARVRTAIALIKTTSERVAEAERRVGGAQNLVDRLATEVLEAGLGDADSARVSREVDRAEMTLTKFSARIVEQHIDRITKNILQALRALLRKEGLISRIEIDASTLQISLFGRTGDRLDPARLSAGERQMLATAVLWGLSRSTGRTLPTVIDTPVGRLDRSHRSNLVNRYFPSAARQVVLLSTDEEIIGDYLEQLHPYVGRSYLLDYDDDKDSTLIREGYFA